MRKLIYEALQKMDILLHDKGRKVRVLAYHTVPDQEAFNIQLQYLISEYSIVDIQQLKDHLFYSKKLPENPLLITFDDGDPTVLQNGLPILNKYNLPSVCFVITGLIDTSQSFWWKRIEKTFEEAGKTHEKAREKVRYYKRTSNRERIDFLAKLPQQESRQLTGAELQKMGKNQMFIGNHSHTHPMVNLCTEAEVIEELKASRKKFDEWQLDGYDVFAYPNGNWDPGTENILKSNGIEIAFLFDHKVNKGRINPLRISRIMVDTDMEINEFKVKVSGFHSDLRELKKKISFGRA